MLGRITREAESITINGSGIQGVQSISASYDSVAAPLRNLGINSIQFAPEGPQSASLSVNSLFTHTASPSAPVTSVDVLQNFTGDIAFSGVVEHGEKSFIFTEGYLDSYSANCSIGEIPQISTSSTIYGEFGTGVLANVPTDSYPTTLNIPSYSSMEINLDTFKTNRVNNFSVSITTPRIPLYALGSATPTGVIAGNPVRVDVNFSIEPDDYEIKNMRFVPEQTVFQDTTITLKKNNTNIELLTYSFNDMLLVSESFQAGATDNATIDFALTSFILR